MYGLPLTSVGLVFQIYRRKCIYNVFCLGFRGYALLLIQRCKSSRVVGTLLGRRVLIAADWSQNGDEPSDNVESFKDFRLMGLADGDLITLYKQVIFTDIVNFTDIDDI